MLEKILQSVYDVVWSPALVIILVVAGLYFTIRTRFVQVRKLSTMAKLVFARDQRKNNGVSPYQAFCLAVSGRVGTGNIVGVATAIAFGGPGSVFWMWIIALFGAATAFVESTLAQIYKFKHATGYRGGPFSYIEEALHCKWLAVVCAVSIVLAMGVFCVPIQTNSVSMAVSNVFTIPLWVTGAVITLLLAIVIVGGVKRIATVAELITPVMSIGYLALSIWVVCVNWRNLPDVFSAIFNGAFGFNQFGGGILGSTIAMGVKRGLYSNEAGQGTGAIVSAAADVDSPEEQGLVQAFSVFIDTLLICTATALMILCTGMYNIYDLNTGESIQMNVPALANNYVGYSQAAVDTISPGIGPWFISIALFFFVFTSLMAYYFYAESGIMYIARGKERLERVLIWILRFALLSAAVVGSLRSTDFAWMLGDIGVGFITWMNVIVILILYPKITKYIK